MGRLEYDSIHEPILIEDETLAHIKIVMTTKLRRQESFLLTWLPRDSADGRLAAWIHPSIPLLFAFEAKAMPKIDPERIEHLMRHLNATGELILDHLIGDEALASGQSRPSS